MTQKIWTGARDKKGRSFGIVEQHTNPDANARRAAKRRVGARQFKKMRRAMRLAQGAA